MPNASGAKFRNHKISYKKIMKANKITRDCHRGVALVSSLCNVRQPEYNYLLLLKYAFPVSINYSWANKKVYQNPEEKFFLNPCQLYMKDQWRFILDFLLFLPSHLMPCSEETYSFIAPREKENVCRDLVDSLYRVRQIRSFMSSEI